MIEDVEKNTELLTRRSIIARFRISRGTLWRITSAKFLTARIGSGRLARFAHSDVATAIDEFSRRQRGR